MGPEGTLPMPAVGLGTFQVKEEAGYEAVKAAIKVRNEKMFGVGFGLSSRLSAAGPRQVTHLSRAKKPGIE